MTLPFLRETKSVQNTGPQREQGIHFTQDTEEGLIPRVVTPFPQVRLVQLAGRDLRRMNDDVCRTPSSRPACGPCSIKVIVMNQWGLLPQDTCVHHSFFPWNKDHGCDLGCSHWVITGREVHVRRTCPNT